MSITFLYPICFLLLAVALLGLCMRGVSRYAIHHPSSFFLAKFKDKIRTEPELFWKRKIKSASLPFLAVLSLAAASLVLAVPQETTRTVNKVAVRREGVCVFDVSGSTRMGEPTIHDIMVKAIQKFALYWKKKYPEDALGCVVFSNSATPLTRPRNDPAFLVEALKNAQRFTTNFGSGTQIDRGLFAGFMMLSSNLSPVDADKFEAVLRSGTDDLAGIKRLLGSNLEKCRSSGRFTIVFTDALVELKKVPGMTPPMAIIDLMGECGITPFVVTDDSRNEFADPVRRELTDAVTKHRGKAYFVKNFQDEAEVGSVISDIARRVPPAPQEDFEEIKNSDKSDFFLRISFVLALFWICGTLLRKRKHIPF